MRTWSRSPASVSLSIAIMKVISCRFSPSRSKTGPPSFSRSSSAKAPKVSAKVTSRPFLKPWRKSKKLEGTCRDSSDAHFEIDPSSSDPHPNLLPHGEGTSLHASNEVLRQLPLPEGEGLGEGQMLFAPKTYRHL